MADSYRFDKEPFLTRLAKALQEEGYVFSSPSVRVGVSGVEHTFDIQVQSDIAQGSVLVDIASSPSRVDEVAVLGCFAKSLDVNPAKMVLIAHPAMSGPARNLANDYRILVIEARSPEEASQRLLSALGEITGQAGACRGL